MTPKQTAEVMVVLDRIERSLDGDPELVLTADDLTEVAQSVVYEHRWVEVADDVDNPQHGDK